MKLVIDLPDEVVKWFKEKGFIPIGQYLMVDEAMKKAEPLSEALDKNKGEWKEVVEEKFPNGEKRMWHYECSACSAGEPFCPINKEHWDFCPNCGADMRGGKE